MKQGNNALKVWYFGKTSEIFSAGKIIGLKKKSFSYLLLIFTWNQAEHEHRQDEGRIK